MCHSHLTVQRPSGGRPHHLLQKKTKMKKLHLKHLLIISFLTFPVGIIMACTNSQNVPVQIIGNENTPVLQSPREQNLIIDIIRQQFLTDDSAPCYNQVKIEILQDSTPARGHFLIYLMHRDTYFVETVGITTDAKNRITAIDRTPFK